MQRKRVPQPPVNPLLRTTEQHDFWPGAILAAVALILVFSGARHLTNLETLDGSSTWETELITAFARGGLQFHNASVTFDPAMHADPAAAAAAMDEAARIADLPLRARYRVNTGAVDPCPT
jgi:hypothetical protein